MISVLSCPIGISVNEEVTSVLTLARLELTTGFSCSADNRRESSSLLPQEWIFMYMCYGVMFYSD